MKLFRIRPKEDSRKIYDQGTHDLRRKDCSPERTVRPESTLIQQNLKKKEGNNMAASTVTNVELTRGTAATFPTGVTEAVGAGALVDYSENDGKILLILKNAITNATYRRNQ